MTDYNDKNIFWLESHLGDRLAHIRDMARLSFRDLDSNQCKHDGFHCLNIENVIHHLIPGELYSKLCPEERFFLLASPWIMNIAWYETKNGLDNGRPSDEKWHEKACLDLNEDVNRKVLGIDQEEARIFQLMIMYHSFTRSIQDCPEKIAVGPNYIRVRLLTAYLRLADAIHVDDCGGPTSLFYFLQDPNSPELFHWFKSKLQLIIQPKPENRTIEVYVNKHIDTSENLIERIRSELELHINSIKDTLVVEGITNYLSVVIISSEGPQMSNEKRVELEKLMKEYAMSFPPNAGTLQSLYLSSIKKVIQKINEINDAFKEIMQIQAIAKEAHHFRPCHIGLKRYIMELDHILKEGDNNSKKLNKIGNWINKSINERERRLKEVYNLGSKELYDFENFLVFGFSNTIIETFNKMYAENIDKRSINIYVCEAHNKSRIDAARRLVYVDGINYAENLREAHQDAKIEIIPDITVASIFKSHSSSKWVVLFGANGISNDANCGHSAGHLSIAILAKYFNIPVYILCDSYKIGKFDYKDSMLREDQWLKGFPGWQLNRDFVLENLRESVIESNLIEKIITEDGSFTIPEFQIKYKKFAEIQ